jgi:tRNA G18 (ribose-2'-O)-methylase SpoU
MGTVWKLPLWRVEDVWASLEAWKVEDGKMVAAALTPECIPVQQWAPAPRTALVLGPEGPGLAQEDLARCDQTVRISMAEGVDSLNVAAAGAILMHWMVKDRQGA